MQQVRFILILISVILLVHGYISGNGTYSAISSLLALIVWLWEYFDGRIDAGTY